NFDVVKDLVKCGLFVEVGGGIRNLETVEKYLAIGVSRVILGTAAVENRDFLIKTVEKYGDKIAVGVDIKDGFVAIKGWTEKSNLTAFDFMKDLEKIGVRTVICTDISKDGAMKGTNHQLYANLMKEVGINIIASGGVSSIDDVKHLAEKGVYGAIIGKAYYTGAIDLKEAIEVAK
ncbi:MAG: HisA/HisF-related TIM barrel protein, partial [Clostridia bacterium]|nr:HisA/HisF-related TIM barrel protein [Clostridia bacterium]